MSEVLTGLPSTLHSYSTSNASPSLDICKIYYEVFYTPELERKNGSLKLRELKAIAQFLDKLVNY